MPSLGAASSSGLVGAAAGWPAEGAAVAGMVLVRSAPAQWPQAQAMSAAPMAGWVADQGAVAALGFGQVQGEHVVVDAQQLGHLTDQLVLHTLRRKLVGLDIELRQHFGRNCRSPAAGAALGILLPRALTGLAHDRQPLDLVATEATIEHGWDRRQQVAHRIGHAADVRLLHGEAVGAQATGQLGLAQGRAAFRFIELARLLDAQGALDEREAAAQFVLGEMPSQGDDLPARRPGPEQARYAEKALVLVSAQSSRRIASLVLPPLRMM